MKEVESDVTFCIDIDETIILWVDDIKPTPKEAVEFNFYGQTIYAIPHEDHIRLMKASAARGRNTVVWSGNGKAWVKEVLTKLGLADLDVLVMTKPVGYLDDSPAQNWMGQKVYLQNRIIEKYRGK